MKQRMSSTLSLGFLLLTLAGCASSGNGDGDDASDVYRENMGQVVLGPLIEAREKIWQRHSIPLRREESTYRTLYWESEWIPRQPTTEEAAEGVTDARNRVIIEGRRTSVTMDGAPSFSVTHRVENQARSAAIPEWHPAPIPESVRTQYRRIYSDLMLEVRAGVRR